MSERDLAGRMQPPGWLFDDETGRTRWWDGVRWTDLAKPLDPVVRTAPASTRTAMAVESVPLPGNGTAAAALLFAALGALGLAAGFWLIGGLDSSTITLLALVTSGLVAVALVLSIVALVIAVRRPTRKAASIIALVASCALVTLLVMRLLDTFAA